LNESGDMGDLDELFEAFSLFDKDCNGVISKEYIC
jgi:Ca2+-binding EF-hand superfamily protein